MHWIKTESQMDPGEYWCWGWGFVSNSFQKYSKQYDGLNEDIINLLPEYISIIVRFQK